VNRGGLGEQVEGGDGFVSVGFCFDDRSQVAEQGLKVSLLPSLVWLVTVLGCSSILQQGFQRDPPS
jgi:hypothetical protein